MTFQVKEIGGIKILVSSGQGMIGSLEDALEVLSLGGEQGCDRIVFHASDFPSGFYDLKTGLAGEILQKFSTYRIRVAIVGSLEHVHSKRFHEFIYECNKGQQLRFMATVDQALDWLEKTR